MSWKGFQERGISGSALFGARVRAVGTLVALTATLAALGLWAAPTAASGSFSDDFSGSSLNTALWDTSVDVSSLRFCPDSVDGSTGTWVDPTTDACGGRAVSAPYGTISVGGGMAAASAPFGSVFPYVVAGPPDRPSPFPNSGGFDLSLQIRFDRVGGFGDGVWVANFSSARPTGSNSPWLDPQTVLYVWGDTAGVRAVFFGSPIYPADPFAFHEYRLHYANGAYSLFIDNALAAGPMTSSVRPNTLWFGNPLMVWWGSSDWTSFTLDSISLTPLTVTTVSIDIRPGAPDNNVNSTSRALIPVAILSTGTFDARRVVPASVCFGSATNLAARDCTANPAQGKLTDVNHDSRLDLVLRFDANQMGIQPGDATACLNGQTSSGGSIEGCDAIHVSTEDEQ